MAQECLDHILKVNPPLLIILKNSRRPCPVILVTSTRRVVFNEVGCRLCSNVSCVRLLPFLSSCFEREATSVSLLASADTAQDEVPVEEFKTYGVPSAFGSIPLNAKLDAPIRMN